MLECSILNCSGGIMGAERRIVILEYNGQSYNGWQSQPQGRFVQTELEKALSDVADHPVKTVASGRTDSGVHATAQVVHFETTSRRSDYGWICGLNTVLPHDISVISTQKVRPTFHARYNALARRYRYLFYVRTHRPAFMPEHATWVRKPLDAKAMHEAAQVLVGEHDFSSFRDANCQSQSPRRHVYQCNVTQQDRFIAVDITASAFVHHMVRNIAGSLLHVGQGKRHPSWIAHVLKAKDRRRAGPTAPPNGLYFVKTYYPESDNIDDHEIGPHFLPGERCRAPCQFRIMDMHKKETV